MAGKWSKYRSKLKALPVDGPYQEKVNAEKERLLKLAKGQKAGKADAESANVFFLGSQLAAAKRAKDRLEDKVYDVNVTIEALGQLLVDRLEGEEQEGVDLRGGLSVGIKDDIYPMMTDRKKFFAWIKKTRQIDLLSIHFKRFQSVVKDYLTNGRPIPPGSEVFIKTTATIRGLKTAGKENGDE